MKQIDAYGKLQYTMFITHRFSTYSVRNVILNLFSREILLSRLPKHVELSHKWIKKSSIRSHIFTLDCLMIQKTHPLKSLLDVQRHTIKSSVPDAPKLYIYSKIRVLVCSVSCNLHLYSLVIKFPPIVLKNKLQPC